MYCSGNPPKELVVAKVVTHVRIVFTNIEEDDCCHAKPGAEKY